MKTSEMEKVAEISKKYGSYNTLLAFVILMASLGMGTIIWQNTRALDKIARSQETVAIEMVATKVAIDNLNTDMRDVKSKLDYIFFQKYEVVQRGGEK